MAQVRWTEQALWWLQEIHSFIHEDNPQAADRVVDGILEKIDLLPDFPEIGYRYRKHPARDVRIVLYGHYRIAYMIEAEDMIVLLGIFHGALDMERHLI